MEKFKETKLVPLSAFKNDVKPVTDWPKCGSKPVLDEHDQIVERNIVYIVDADARASTELSSALSDLDCDIEQFSDCASFVAYYRPGRFGCLIVDALQLADHGLDLIGSLKEDGQNLHTIVISDDPSSAMIVQTMRAGAFDFIEKQHLDDRLAQSIRSALNEQARLSRVIDHRAKNVARLATLTPREREIMEHVLAGHPSKNIAYDLGISQRTVENHRASISRKLETKNLSALIHKVLSTRSETGVQTPPASNP